MSYSVERFSDRIRGVATWWGYKYTIANGGSSNTPFVEFFNG
jgi:hypothetical protein